MYIMLRTQIYLPEEMHRDLWQLAVQEKTTISQLIRKGVANVLKRGDTEKTTKKSLLFFANPRKEFTFDLKGRNAAQLVRNEREI